MKSPDRYGGMDCFVLTTGAVRAQRQVQAGREVAAARAATSIRRGPGTFKPEPDKFDPAAVLDLRNLNEKTAGEHGFIKLSPDGNSFLRGDGQPMRFWAAGERTGVGQKMETFERQARFLAKRGVNLLRIFAMLPSQEANSKITDVNEQELDAVFKVVAAMKRRRHLHHRRRILARRHAPAERLGRDQPGTRRLRRSRLFRPEVPGRPTRLG